MAKRGDEVVATRSVGADWWAHVERSRKARDDLKERLNHSSAVHSVTTVSTDENLNGHAKRELEVILDQDNLAMSDLAVGDDLRSRLDVTIPRHHAGLKVNLKSTSFAKATCENQSTFNPVPGGVALLNPDQGTIGTACCRILNTGSGDTYLMLTAEHNHDMTDDVDQWSNDFGNPTTRRDGGLDYQLVEKTNSNLLQACSVEYNNSLHELGGHATNLEVLEDEEQTLFKTGVTAGYQTGEITNLQGDTVHTDIWGAQGDSGGPIFYVEDFGYPMGERAIMVAMLTNVTADTIFSGCGYDAIAGDSLGTSAEAIANDDGDIVFAGCSS